MKRTARKSRTRRTSIRKHRMRKNKTMRGGLFSNFAYGTVSADVFKKTGYARAKEALYSYEWPIIFKVNGKINSGKLVYLYEGLTGDKKVPKYILNNDKSQYIPDPNGNKVEILKKDEFKEILEYILENKIENKNDYLPVQVVRNDRYAKFAESLEYLKKNATKIQITENEKPYYLKKTDLENLENMTKKPPSLLQQATNEVASMLASPQAQKLGSNLSTVLASPQAQQLKNSVVGTVATQVAKNVPGGALAGFGVKAAAALAPKIANVAVNQMKKDPAKFANNLSSLATSASKSGFFKL